MTAIVVPDVAEFLSYADIQRAFIAGVGHLVIVWTPQLARGFMRAREFYRRQQSRLDRRHGLDRHQRSRLDRRHGLDQVVGDLKLARELVGVDVAEAAARGGHVHVLEWLEATPTPKLLVAAAGSLAAMQFLTRQGTCPGDFDFSEVVRACIHAKNMETLEHIYSNCVAAVPAAAQIAAESECHEALEIIARHKPLMCQSDYSVALVAVEFNDLVMLMLAHRLGFPWSEQTCDMAAYYGAYDCLVYLHDNACPWTSLAWYFAASEGRLSCLQYVHEHGCEWDPDACELAAFNGHLKCLRYLREQGVPYATESLIDGVKRRRRRKKRRQRRKY